MTALAALGLLLGLGSTARADCADGRPINIGHRGTGNSSPSNPVPENTVPSILAAIEEGATMVEIDVQLSADAVPVLMHDVRVDGTTDGTGCVSELTVDELKQLDAGVGTPVEGMGAQVPTLLEVLEAAPIALNVEMKAGGSGCPVFTDAEFVSAVLDALDAAPREREVLVSSFDFALMEEVRSQDPSIRIGHLTFSHASAPAASDAGFDALVLAEASADETALTETRAAGLELYVWTVNDPERLAQMVALDVDGIITDEPPALEEARAQACPSEGEDSTSGEPPTDSTTTPPTGSTGDGSTGDGAPPPADASSSSATTTGAMNEGDTGCGCRSTPSSVMGPWALVLLGLARRRRQVVRATSERSA